MFRQLVQYKLNCLVSSLPLEKKHQDTLKFFKTYTEEALIQNPYEDILPTLVAKYPDRIEITTTKFESMDATINFQNLIESKAKIGAVEIGHLVTSYTLQAKKDSPEDFERVQREYSMYKRVFGSIRYHPLAREMMSICLYDSERSIGSFAYLGHFLGPNGEKGKRLGSSWEDGILETTSVETVLRNPFKV